MERPTAFLSDPPPSPPVAAAYDADVESDGYVSNFTRLWCWRPDVFTAFATMRADLMADSSLSPREFAVMVASAAAARGDSYCALAWGQKLAALSDDVTAAGVLRGHDAGLSGREAALMDWSRRVIGDPNATSEADVERLREAGLTDREIFEATTWIALRFAFSTINDALGAQPDRQLAEDVPQPVREAVTFGRPSAP